MGIDPEKLFVLLVIALIVLGPERLPKIARSLGRGLAEVRKYTAAARAEMDQVLAEPRSVVQSALREADLEDLTQLANLRNPMRYIASTASQAALGTGTANGTGNNGLADEDGGADNAPGGPVMEGDQTRESSQVAQFSQSSVPSSGQSDFLQGTSGGPGAGSWAAAEPSDLPLPDDPSLN